jgi:hypothetical protein
MKYFSTIISIFDLNPNNLMFNFNFARHKQSACLKHFSAITNVSNCTQNWFFINVLMQVYLDESILRGRESPFYSFIQFSKLELHLSLDFVLLASGAPFAFILLLLSFFFTYSYIRPSTYNWNIKSSCHSLLPLAQPLQGCCMLAGYCLPGCPTVQPA